MLLQTPSIQYQNLPAEVASAIGSVKRQLRRLNVSSAGVLVRSFGESETGDGRGGGVYHAKVFKTKNIGGYSLYRKVKLVMAGVEEFIIQKYLKLKT